MLATAAPAQYLFAACNTHDDEDDLSCTGCGLSNIEDSPSWPLGTPMCIRQVSTSMPEAANPKLARSENMTTGNAALAMAMESAAGPCTIDEIAKILQ
jgi:hypothetical protein